MNDFLDLGINDMVNITGGPLSYNYPIYEISVHFGLRDEQGSEHTIGKKKIVKKSKHFKEKI